MKGYRKAVHYFYRESKTSIRQGTYKWKSFFQNGTIFYKRAEYTTKKALYFSGEIKSFTKEGSKTKFIFIEKQEKFLTEAQVH